MGAPLVVRLPAEYQALQSALGRGAFVMSANRLPREQNFSGYLGAQHAACRRLLLPLFSEKTADQIEVVAVVPHPAADPGPCRESGNARVA
jgi:hypothetical protein